MTALPDYTVLIPVWIKDNPVFVRQSIDSILRQTYRADEILILCDGPLTNDLNEMLSKFETENKEVKVIHFTENRGLGPTLADGVLASSNAIVARMDSDDISKPERLEKEISVLEYGGYDIVGSAIEEFQLQPGDMSSVRILPTEHSKIAQFSKTRNPFNHMSVVFRKESVIRAGNYRSFYLLEDYDLWVRMLLSGSVMHNLADALVYVRTGNGMISRRGGISYLKSQIKLLNAFYDYGFISRLDQITGVLARCLITLAPSKLRGLIYSVFLRKPNSGDSCEN
ncbi:glycosyltransferase [uncultured Slackia sp.]|uniref:glycosyltransferase n=1 Tax=uncultured Slackia sp. TaxID=665903 RepID=UPI0025D4655D|nr:glycosyltransferase [uncultured Slackia sp.]